MADEITNNFPTDPKTGYLIVSGGTSVFTPDLKTQFLKAYEETGNQTAAARAIGIGARTVRYHLKADKQFKADYDSTLEAMKHRLESTMYQQALTPRGTMDRFGWLRKHFPDEYNPKATIEHKEDKNKLENLYKDAIIWEAEIVKDGTNGTDRGTTGEKAEGSGSL